MRIEGAIAGLAAARESALTPGLAVRLLAGDLSALRLGEQLPAAVVETRGAVTVLALKGALVQVEGLPRLPPGTEVAVKVTGLSPAPALEIAPGPRLSLPPLAVGQEVVARVLQQLPGGRLLIDVHGVPLDASAPPGIEVGAEFPVRVVALQPQIVLQIVGDQPAAEVRATQMIRANLGDFVPAGESLAALRKAVAETPAPPLSLARLETVLARLLPDEGAVTAERLAALVRDGGLLYEAKLARAVPEGGEALARVADGDVKGLLLRALRDLGEAPAATRNEALTAALARHLGNVETQQALNLLALLHGDAFQLQVPLLAGRDLTTAFLAIEPDGEQGRRRQGTPGGYNVLFLLELDGLGRTRIDAHIGGGTMRVIFYLEQAEALGRVEAGLPAFAEVLRSLGYDTVLLAARPLAELPAEQRQKLEAIALGVPTGGRLVDVRA